MSVSRRIVISLGLLILETFNRHLLLYTMPLQTTRHNEARSLNLIIDRALIQPGKHHQQAVVALVENHDVERLADRIRRRATYLGRGLRQQAQQILSVRDELVMSLYASLTPTGWANAWCDGSSIKHDNRLSAGIGAIIVDTTNRCVAQISRNIGNKSAFEAEIAALVATLEIARLKHLECIRVHSDNKALVQLWHERRNDPRMIPIRQIARDLKRLQIRPIPRRHNQVANALAKQAATVRKHTKLD